MLANLMSITLNTPTEIGLIGLLVHRIDRLTVTDRVEQLHTVAWPRARKQPFPRPTGRRRPSFSFAGRSRSRGDKKRGSSLQRKCSTNQGAAAGPAAGSHGDVDPGPPSAAVPEIGITDLDRGDASLLFLFLPHPGTLPLLQESAEGRRDTTDRRCFSSLPPWRP